MEILFMFYVIISRVLLLIFKNLNLMISTKEILLPVNFHHYNSNLRIKNNVELSCALPTKQKFNFFPRAFIKLNKQ